jgi:hypothetical protein
VLCPINSHRYGLCWPSLLYFCRFRVELKQLPHRLKVSHRPDEDIARQQKANHDMSNSVKHGCLFCLYHTYLAAKSQVFCAEVPRSARCRRLGMNGAVSNSWRWSVVFKKFPFSFHSADQHHVCILEQECFWSGIHIHLRSDDNANDAAVAILSDA